MTEHSEPLDPPGVADALSAYWDAVVGGAAAADGPPPLGLAATVERLHASDDAPRLLPSQREEIWRAVTAAHGLDAQPRGPAVGALPVPRPAVLNPSPQRSSWRPRWAPGGLGLSGVVPQLATAALLLLTVALGVVAFGPGRPIDRLAELPAIIVPAAPESAPGQVGAFVWQVSGGPDHPFANPSQPAIDPQGRLWIPDSSRDRFALFAPDGTFLETWGAPGSAVGQFHLQDPRAASLATGAVAFDAAGNIYVADAGNFRIQKFGPDRVFITGWGSEGAGAGQFRRPFDIAVDRQGHVYVSDEGWGKIEVFDTNGAWLATWSSAGTPTGLAVDGEDNLWVAIEGNGVAKFSPEGERLALWNEYGAADGQFLDPVSVSVDAEGRVFVADLNADRIQVFAPDGVFLGGWGAFGHDPGQFAGPRGIVLDGHGGVYVTEHLGNRMQKFQLLPPLAPAGGAAP